uniref:ATP-binding cassette domain-containing protein n=1 Tax=Peribacillus sp. TH16 TaxID=2798482 RepID=UPI001A93234C|nr:ATP-binding cassette domain-containing protein [Peribacillus sp. TH16]
MILSVNNIHKSYGKEEVLKGISFDINNSEIVALVGPNGSGKSTLLNIINNLLPAIMVRSIY